MKACIITSAHCPRRRLDATRLKDYFRNNGYRLTRSTVDADVTVLITCAYTSRTEDLAIDMVKRYSRKKNQLLVTGCLPAINPQRLADVFSGISLPAHSLDEIGSHFPHFTVGFAEIPDANRASIAISFPSFRPGNILRRISQHPVLALKMFFKKRRIERAWAQNFYIRTSWGCRGRCSYCVIRSAIGDLRSKPIATCQEELSRGLEHGFSRIVLEGDDTGAYGLDIGSNLPHLLRNLISIRSNFTLELGCLNPIWIVKYAQELTSIAGSGKLGAIECCIQSGSARILKLMNRYHDPDRIIDALIDIKQASPSTILSSHVIVGFPTETEADLEETIDMIERVGFNWVVVFPYEEKEGCRAESIKEKVATDIIRKRSAYIYRRLSRRGVDVLCP